MQLIPSHRRRSLLADARGVAALEFALLAPILILLYFGVVELTQGVMTEQRAAHTASTIGDLVAQSANVSSAEITDIFTIGNTIMYPYPTAPLSMRVSSLQADAKGAVTVAWSQGSGMAALAKGASVTGLPKNVITANETVIESEATYVYTSAFSYVMPKPVTFTEKYFLRPRLSTSVNCADC
jgi:Flp pilus assembly protein TadG